MFRFATQSEIQIADPCLRQSSPARTRRRPFAGTLTARHGANSRRAGKFRRGLAIVDSGRSSHDCGAVVG